jgi:hypothetical protein
MKKVLLISLTCLFATSLLCAADEWGVAQEDSGGNPVEPVRHVKPAGFAQGGP